MLYAIAFAGRKEGRVIGYSMADLAGRFGWIKALYSGDCSLEEGAGGLFCFEAGPLQSGANRTVVRTVDIEEGEWRGREGRLGQVAMIRQSVVQRRGSSQARRRHHGVSLFHD